MKKRHSKKTSTKLRQAIATSPIRVDMQDPAADLPPWQVAMLRRMMNTRRVEPVRCGPKSLSVKTLSGGKPVAEELDELTVDAVTGEAMSAQLELLRDQIALAQHGGLNPGHWNSEDEVHAPTADVPSA